ncbi:3-dehydro-glucose-6-phosphate--glutamate transaminase [Streptomyces sp. SAI-170]|uniref:DegT/DnrJ/EryC1/StrS family aminotransferase n=1 Tax=Streptomyces sp. SAI-170 TaxID=3377729 RepID=UPI003C79D471
MTAETFNGDSHDIHRLVLDVAGGGPLSPYRHAPSLGHRALARVLDQEPGRLRPDAPDSVFHREPTAEGPVPFLPKDRLLTAEEQRVAVDCFARALATGELTSGPAVAEFEDALAGFLGLPHAIATGSGTDALIIALRAVGVGPDDEVIMPANSFAATENAVFACGAVPVLVDVDPVRHTLDPALVAEAVTPRTRAVLPVHLHGRLADVEGIARVTRERGLRVVEDACQAIGVTGVGAHSDAAALSFNPYKNFGLTGKAGAVLTRDTELAERIRMFAYHGFEPGRKNVKAEAYGLNSRIDNSTATVALGLLPRLTLNSYRRAFLAHRYIEALAGTPLGVPVFEADHAWHLFPVTAHPDDREALRARLRAAGVETDLYYPVLTHHQRTPLHHKLFASARLPHTERLHATVFHLPLHNNLSVTEQDRVIEALHAALRHPGH